MKQFFTQLAAGLLFSLGIFAQVTVTGGSNTVPVLAASYSTLAAAVTDLNLITAINGPVVISLNLGSPQTAPAGGYAIQFAANTSLSSNIVFEGNNNTITAFTPQPSGNLNDAIFKLIGADNITILNFTMQENAANTITSPASNTMTEFGVALLRASTTNGAQNNTILNNTISLNRNYTNTFGLYSSVRHAANNITTDPITNVAGSNFSNKVYGNQFSDVNYGVVFIGSTTQAYMDNGNDIGGSSLGTGNSFTNWGTAAAASGYPNLTGSNYCIFLNHQVNENVSFNSISSAVHTSINALGGISNNFSAGQPSGTFTSTYTNNTISLSKSAPSGSVFGINIRGISPALSSATININNNLISNIAVTAAGSASAITGIANSSACGVLNMNNNTVRGCTSTATTPAAGFTGIENTGAVVNNININNNKIGDAVSGAISYSVASPGAIYGINNTQHPVTCSVSIANNDIRGIVHPGGSSGAQQYIINAVSPPSSVGNLIIDGNTFTNLSVNTSGSVYFIFRSGSMTATGTYQCNNNRVVGGFVNNAPVASNMYFYYSPANSQSVNGSAVTVSGNNFSNVTVNGATPVWGSYDLEGLGAANGPSKTYTGNTFNNISTGNATFIGFYISNSGPVTCTTNNLSNILSAGVIVAIWHGTTNGQGTHHVSNNTINNLSSSGNNVVGILVGAPGLPELQVANNSISNLTSGAASGQIVGIDISVATSMLIHDNLIKGLVGSGTTNPFACGLRIMGGPGNDAQVYRNNIQDLRQTGAMSGAGPAVIGLNCGSPATLLAYNNFISDLRANNSAQSDAIRGIQVNTPAGISSYNVYHNSVYINASSAGANFGTSGLFHFGNANANFGRLTMINNIIVNTSTPNGTGFTVAFRRSNTTLTNYAPASDNNLLYAGTPSVNRLIFYDGTNSDQTLAAFQARVAPRDANDISLMPIFISPTNLHLDPANNCAIKGFGTFLPTVNTDIDNDIRMAPHTDMGADEFKSTVYSAALAGVVGAAVCETKAVSGATTYSGQACNRIAHVLPSGASPLTGTVTSCVTLDATQQYFNGEPYVRRHYDIEPATNPSMATASITLYFDDADFVQYNTSNPVWPTLPTVLGGGLSDPNLPNLKITQFHGVPFGGLPTPTPNNYPGTRELLARTINLVGSIWEVTAAVSGFSGFYVHTKFPNSPLPISINYFTGVKQGGNHFLNWKLTCNSTPSATMVLERSANGRNFSAINSITADALRCQQPFNYTDANPMKGINYYRLNITDADGKISYSSQVALLHAVKGFELISIAPNPVVNDYFKLNLTSAEAAVAELFITDMQGRVVRRQSINIAAGFVTVPVDIKRLAKGSYALFAMMGNNRSKLIRFVKQ